MPTQGELTFRFAFLNLKTEKGETTKLYIGVNALAKLKVENELESPLSSSLELESSKPESVSSVVCPVLGEMRKQKCLEYQALTPRFATANPFKAQIWRACRDGCPNSLIGPDGEPIEIEEPEDPQAEQAVFIERLKLLIKKESKNNESHFAREAGLSISGLKRYLAGGDPSRRKLIAIAKSNNVNLLWLATGKGPMRPENQVGEVPGRYDKAEDMQKEMASLTPEQKLQVIDFIREKKRLNHLEAQITRLVESL